MKLILGLTAVLTGLLAWYFAAHSESGPLLRFSSSACYSCHINTLLETDGPIASGFSKGVHSIDENIINSPSVDMSGKNCGICHTKVYDTWQKSAHGQAYTNEIYQQALKRDKQAWCIRCHAPLWNESKDSINQASSGLNPDKTYSHGITCAVCHVRNNQIYGPNKTVSKDAIHPVKYDPTMKDERFCQGCHQFNFPEFIRPVVKYLDGPPMQNTVAEYHGTSWPAKGVTCQNCHFAPGDHSLHNAEQADLRRSFKTGIEVSGRGGRYSLKLSIYVKGIGHHYPTGDLFRILTFKAFKADKEVLRYDIRKEVRAADMHTVSDTTLRPGKEGDVRFNKSFTLTENPQRCTLAYRLQGAIDPRLEKKISPGLLNRVLYDGPCKKKIQI